MAHGAKDYHHPVVGDVTVGYESFTPTGDPDLQFAINTVEPGSASEQAPRLLASWSAELV